MVIHSSFVRNVWISATPRVTSHLFYLSTRLDTTDKQITFKYDESLACTSYPTVSHLSTRSWQSLNEQRSSFTLGKYSLNFCIPLPNVGIYYIWKNIKESHNNNKFKRFAPTWNDEFELLDGSYSISNIQEYF